MKIHRKILLLLMLIVPVSIISACQTNPPIDRAEPTPTTSTIEQSLSYISLTEEDEVKTSGAIFKGKVVSISPTFWNQDSGKAWDSENSGIAALRLHTIEVQIEQKWIDTLGLGDMVTVTGWGVSPLEEYSDYKLAVGDEVVVFLKQAKIAWRGGGTKEVLTYTASPYQSLYMLNKDGLLAVSGETEVLNLDDIENRISAYRDDMLK